MIAARGAVAAEADCDVYGGGESDGNLYVLMMGM